MVEREASQDERAPFEFQSRTVAAGYAYWRSKLRNGSLPARSEIKPSEIPRILPHTVLLDVHRAPELDFGYRLIGTRVVEHLHSDYTGLRMSDIEDQRAPSAIWNNCRTVVETGAPLFPQTPYVGPHEAFRRAEDLILPLAADGGTVDTLLIFIDYLSLAPR